MRGFTLVATDGELGAVRDFYFDDEKWTIRYVVAETGTWLAGRRVLISPIAVRQVDWLGQRLTLGLTRQQVENSPDVDLLEPISRQIEAEYYNYYRWPAYWDGPGLWGCSGKSCGAGWGPASGIARTGRAERRRSSPAQLKRGHRLPDSRKG